ncbi:MAG: hypothetical protein OXI91_16480 [Chloroflexota bacterium]|nr:hypothetical protein [Chloroflexota bacterium]
MSSNSAEDVIRFLDFASQRGLMKKASVVSLKTACNNVFSVLDEAEAADVSSWDLDIVIQRYQNINSMRVRPETMHTYGQRVKYAVTEFMKYNEDPANWKPSGGQRPASSNQASRNARTNQRSSAREVSADPSINEKVSDPSEILHQFPIRKDKVVKITGIPFDVKRSEMSRLTNFLGNLVAEEEGELGMPPMLKAPDSEESY